MIYFQIISLSFAIFAILLASFAISKILKRLDDLHHRILRTEDLLDDIECKLTKINVLLPIYKTQ
jgi:hypothetical protein